jgi:hypothetical protein
MEADRITTAHNSHWDTMTTEYVTIIVGRNALDAKGIIVFAVKIEFVHGQVRFTPTIHTINGMENLPRNECRYYFTDGELERARSTAEDIARSRMTCIDRE